VFSTSSTMTRQSLSLALFLLGVSVCLANGFTASYATFPSITNKRASFVQTTIAGNPTTTTTTTTTQLAARKTDIRNRMLMELRGGAAGAASSETTFTTLGGTPLFVTDAALATKRGLGAKVVGVLGSLWGSMGVIYILAKAMKRVLPIALEPFAKETTMLLSPFQWRYVCVREYGYTNSIREYE
jgi:hypothetical protein